MSIADKLLQVNQVKQDIKTAIETKGIPMTNVAFTEYANKILDISGGGGSPLLFTDDLEQAQKVKEVFALSDKVSNLNKVWEDYKRTPELKYDLALTKVAENQDLAGNSGVDIYIGNSDLITLYNDCVNGTINDDNLYITNTLFVLEGASEYVDAAFEYAAFEYYGDISSLFGAPFPVYSFGLSQFTEFSFSNLSNLILLFLVADLTPLEMGLGISLMKYHVDFFDVNTESIKIYSKYSNYKQGLIADLSEEIMYSSIQYNMPLYIDDTVDFIEEGVFKLWTNNNYPLVIPDSVVSIGTLYHDVDAVGAFGYWTNNDKQIIFGSNLKHIGSSTFRYWTANNQPLALPEGLETISAYAFRNWQSNNHPLVIPNSVQSIGYAAFYGWEQVPYIIMESETPPTLEHENAFDNQNNAPIYVPNNAVDDYKNATNWSALASRIFPISDK